MQVNMPKIGDIAKGKDLGYRSCGRNRYIWHACPQCKKERWIMLSRAKRTIPPSCRSCSSENRAVGNYLGNKNSQWKGGRHLIETGYTKVWLNPNSPYFSMVTKNKSHRNCSILEHRLVMAESLGRCLYPGEIVHHINGIKCDNRIENLHLVNIHNHERHTFEKVQSREVKQLQIEVRLLKFQINMLTKRLNKSTEICEV